MQERIKKNLLDSFLSVMPISIIVLIISFYFKIDASIIVFFAISSIFLIFGIALFTSGADLSMIIIGENIGKTLIKTKKKWLIYIASFIVGVVITVAEPDLRVLAQQLTSIPDALIITMVGIGVGLFLFLAVFRIMNNISYNKLITYSLIGIFVLLFFVPLEFIPVSFDSGGVTTGPMGVPLIVAFGYGLTKVLSNKKSKDDSLGLCGICSLGPILIILIMGLFFKTDGNYNLAIFTTNNSLMKAMLTLFVTSLRNVLLSLLPIVLLFTIVQLFARNIKKKNLKQISLGILLTVLGLTLFLTGVNLGFLKMGYFLGNKIALSDFKYLILPLGMIIGYIIIDAEPAVKVLNKQISDLTEGAIKENIVKLCLSVSVCIAIGLSLLRIFLNVSIIYFLIPGYLLTIILSYKSPKIFTSIAFDSGGAVSGPLTTSFLLPICIGSCVALNGNIFELAFGVVALVSMMPLITIQLLGILYEYRKNKNEIDIQYNEEIVEYNWEV